MKTLADREGLIFSPPQLGCVLYLPGLPGGGSRIHDRSPYGNHGTITGAVWKRLPSGLWYLSYDGSDDNTTVNDAYSLDAIVCFEVWINRLSEHAVSPAVRSLFMKNDSNLHGLRFESDYTPDQLRCIFYDGSSTSIAAYSMPAVGTWLHVVGQYESNRARLYINGVYNTQGNVITGHSGSNADPVRIGGKAGNFSNVEMALLRAYNSILPAQLIIRHFQEEKHLFGVW